MSTHKYQVKVSQLHGGKGGAEGRIGVLSNPINSNFKVIKIQSPSEFKGPKDKDGKSLDWTPEDLYVSSVAVCFFTTFVAIAENSNLNYSQIDIVATGKLENVPEIGDMITKITERITLLISEEKDRRKAKRILEKTERNCLIANSMKTRIFPKYEVKVEQRKEVLDAI